MDQKPFPVAKAFFGLAAVSLIAAFLFLVPVKPRTGYPKSEGPNHSYRVGPPPADHSKPGYTLWDLLVGND